MIDPKVILHHANEPRVINCREEIVLEKTKLCSIDYMDDGLYLSSGLRNSHGSFNTFLDSFLESDVTAVTQLLFVYVGTNYRLFTATFKHSVCNDGEMRLSRSNEASQPSVSPKDLSLEASLMT